MTSHSVPVLPRRRGARSLAVVLACLLVGALLAPGAAVAAGVAATATVTASSPQGLTVQVKGTGYARPPANPVGIYVALGVRGSLDPVDASAYVKADFVRPTGIAANGSFTHDLVLDAAQVAALDPSREYAVYTLKAHGQAVGDPSQNLEVPVTIDFTTLVEPEPEPEPEPVPSVSVSRTEVSSEGATTVTVTGRDFVPSLATGVRPPLAGKPAGAYVVFGRFASVWQPSKGAPSSTRVNTSQKWAVPAGSMQAIGGAAGGAVELSEDGSFTAEVTIDKGAIDAKATAASLTEYGIFTYAGSGAAAAAYETATPITFVDPEPEPEPEPVPSVSVSRTEVSSEGATTVTVTGRDFVPSLATGVRPPLAGKAAGAYVVFGRFASVWQPSKGAPSSTRVNTSQKWAVPAGSMQAIGGAAGGAVELSEDGSFTAEVTIDKGAIDAKATAASLTEYGIFTYAGSGAAVAAYETATPITFVEPEPEPAGPALEVGVAEQVQGSLVVDVAGSGYATTAPGVYLGIAEAGGASAVDASVYRGTVFVPHTAMGTGGTFERRLSLDAAAIATLDPTKEYSVYSLKAHGQAASDPSQTVEVPLDLDVALLQGGPTTPVGPHLEASVAEQVEGSLEVDVAGVGYRPEAPGVYLGIAESGGASAVDASVYRGTVFVSHLAYGLGGTFERRLSLDAAAIATLDPTKEYSVYSLKAHGQAASDPSQTVEVPLDLDVALLQGTTDPTDPTDPEPDRPTLTTSIVQQVRGSLRIEVRGSGYATTSPGVYVGLSESGGASAVDAAAYRGTVFVPHTAMGPNGTFTRTLALGATDIATLDRTKGYSVYTLKAHGQAAADPSQTVERRVAIDVALLQGGSTSPTDPTPPTTPPTPPGTGGGGSGQPAVRTAGSLSWGVAADFRSYVTGPIAKGSVTVSGGASATAGGYRFYQRSSSATGREARGATGYGGAVRFSGHAGALDLRLADPTVTVAAGGRGTLSVVVDGTRRDLASLDLGAATLRRSGADVTYSGVPATLTASGASAFQGFYAAGRALDPVSFTVGADTTAGRVPGGGTTRTVASAAASDDDAFVPPATPPSTTGATLTVDDPEGIRAGDRISATTEGFRPGETGIAVVVYSTPVVLDRAAAADAEGRVTWSGTLPGDLEPGKHTLTFQGSVDRGVTFTVTEEDEVGRCEVEDATLTWGVKESFRAYVSGSIANGDWSTSGGATYTTPTFTFADGSGTFDGERHSGDVAFEGALEFTGHDGALDLTLADPVVRFVDRDTAMLFLDVTGASRAAAEAGDTATTTTDRVPFVEIDLAAAERGDGDELVLTGAATTLTEQGHAVFETYETGTAFDPVDLAVAAADDCAAAAPVTAPSSGGPNRAAGLTGDTGTDARVWWMAGGAAALLVLGAGLWALRRRGVVA